MPRRGGDELARGAVSAITDWMRLYQGMTLDTLLSKRTKCVEEIERIDEELGLRGVRAVAKPIGRARDVAALVIAELAKGPRSLPEIIEATGQTPHAAGQMMSKMFGAGEVRRVGRGKYALPDYRRGGS